jgi:nucleoside-diphosphate-sugar epimerase
VKVLVTGASGFIGRHVVAALARQGRWRIVTASRSPVVPHPDAEHHAVDLLAPGAGPDLITRIRPTHLLHLAWNATPGRFWTAADNLDWTASSLALLHAFTEAGGERAVFAGTCAEYDWTGPGRLSEGAPTRPATLYGACKDALRRAVDAANDHLNASVAWGRVFWLYGPGEPGGRLVSDVACSLADGRAVAVGDGVEARDFLHVEDVASAFVAALASTWKGPFNIGSGRAVPVRRLIEILARTSGRPELVQFGARPAPPGQPKLLEADTTVLEQAIGWAPAVDLDQGLAATYDWWRTQRDRART